MMRSRILVAVLLSALTACGGDDDDDDSKKDQRSNVTGSYDVEGTMEASAGGESESQQVTDVVSISNGTSSNQALQLHFASLNCGPEATMKGDRSFSIVKTTCPLPTIENCTVALVFTSGQGSRDSSGGLTLSASGTMDINCGFATLSGPFSMDLTGTRVGQALPGPQAQALASTAAPTAVLQRLVQAARQ